MEYVRTTQDKINRSNELARAIKEKKKRAWGRGKIMKYLIIMRDSSNTILRDFIFKYFFFLFKDVTS